MRRLATTLTTALCLSTFGNAHAAITSGYGALADVGTYDSCATICLRPGGLDFQVLNGGEFLPFATAGIDNASGTSFANAAFTGDVFSPILRASSSSPIGTTASDAQATAIQAWTYTGAGPQDYSIVATLSGTVTEPTSSAEGLIRGDIAAYLYEDATFINTGIGTFLGEVVPGEGTLLARDTSFLTPGLDLRTATLDFTLNPGDEVYLFMRLETKSERGAVVDATGTFLMEFTGGDTSELTETVVPIPAAVWLFGSGLLGLIGLARRKAA